MEEPLLERTFASTTQASKPKKNVSFAPTHDAVEPPFHLNRGAPGSRHIRAPSLQQIRPPVAARPKPVRIKYYIESLPVRLMVVLLVLCDLGLLVYVTLREESPLTTGLTWGILILYSVELMIRVAVNPDFFEKFPDVLDAVVICGSVILQGIELSLASHSVALVRFVRVMRIVRAIRVLVVSHAEIRHVIRATRRQISQNRRRFHEGSLELDLTYITDRVMAMSLPATYMEAFYRNSVGDVARCTTSPSTHTHTSTSSTKLNIQQKQRQNHNQIAFLLLQANSYFNKNYRDHYRIYNLCAERPGAYDETKFHNRVARYPIEDHNVPTLDVLVRFCSDVQTFLDNSSQNVVAVHCRGGRGRTGLCICAWMLHAKLFPTAQECLDVFGSRRTDESISENFQGVQTPSQYRYVQYYEHVMQQHAGVCPPLVTRRICSVRVWHLPPVHIPRGKDSKDLLSLKVFRAHTLVMDTDAANVLCELNGDHVEFVFKPALCVCADVKLQFFSRLIKAKKCYDNCFFYAWFHCSLEDSSNELVLSRDCIDNAQLPQNRVDTVFPVGFRLEVEFANHASSC